MNEAGTRGRTAGLLAMVTAALHSLNAGVDPRHQICRDLDGLVGATGSVYVVRRVSGVLQVSPPSGAVEPHLVDRALRLLQVQVRPFRFGHEHPAACVPLSRTRARTSAVVLCGTLREPLLLEEVGSVLREVDALLDGFRPVGATAVSLTPRELEVLRLLAEGLLARTIAMRLSLSPRTVHHHLGSIYDKLEVRDRLAAVLKAREQGLLLSDPHRRARGSPRRRAGEWSGPRS